MNEYELDHLFYHIQIQLNVLASFMKYDYEQGRLQTCYHNKLKFVEQKES